MSDNGLSKRKIWVGASVLALVAAGALFAGQYIPLKSNETAGTIVPAERYRVQQVGNTDVKLGDKTMPQLMQTDSFQAVSSHQ